MFEDGPGTTVGVAVLSVKGATGVEEVVEAVVAVETLEDDEAVVEAAAAVVRVEDDEAAAGDVVVVERVEDDDDEVVVEVEVDVAVTPMVVKALGWPSKRTVPFPVEQSHAC